MSGRRCRALAALALGLVLLSGCAEQEAQDALEQAREEASQAADDAELPDVALPNVDLDGYSAEFQDRLEELTANADCDGLKRELAKARGNDSELTRFLKEQLRELNC